MKSKYSCGIVAAIVCAGAVSSASFAEETNWDALESSGWSVAAGPADDVRSAEAGSVGQADIGAAIQSAFVDLGMAEDRAACYGEVLVQQLSPEDQQQAAELVRGSANADEVKTSVITSGPAMVGGFSAADAMCPEGS